MKISIYNSVTGKLLSTNYYDSDMTHRFFPRIGETLILPESFNCMNVRIVDIVYDARNAFSDLFSSYDIVIWVKESQIDKDENNLEVV